MVERFPIFTDGKKYYHGHGKYPKNCRFAYWSYFSLDDWLKEEKPKLKGAKEVFDRWDKKC